MLQFPLQHLLETPRLAELLVTQPQLQAVTQLYLLAVLRLEMSLFLVQLLEMAHQALALVTVEYCQVALMLQLLEMLL
jgi:hypothetical protein